MMRKGLQNIRVKLQEFIDGEGKHLDDRIFKIQNGKILFFLIVKLKFGIGSMFVFTQPLHHRQDVTQGQFSSEVRLVWIQFSIAEERRDGLIPFLGALAWKYK